MADRVITVNVGDGAHRNEMSIMTPQGNSPDSFIVRCFFWQRGGDWEALCVDYDLAVQGHSYSEVYDRMTVAVQEYLKYVETLPEGERARFRNRSVR